MGKHCEILRWKEGTSRDRELEGLVWSVKETVVGLLLFATA